MNLNLDGGTQAVAGFYFSVEIGPDPENVNNFTERVFYALGLITPDRIRAYDNYTSRFNIKTYSQDIINRFRNDQRLANALRNDGRKKSSIKVYVPPSVIEHLRSFGILIAASGQGEAKVTGFTPSLGENVKKHLKTEADFSEVREKPISQWTTVEKLDSVIRRAAILLPEDVGKELLKLLEPAALVAIAVVLGLWAVGHFFVVSEIADVLLALGGLALGVAAYQAGGHLYHFAVKCINGKTKQDLDESAQHLAEAIALIGVQTVMTLLLVKAPKVFTDSAGIKLSELPSVKRPMGEWFYKPKIKAVDSFSNPYTLGKTTIYGDIEYLSSLTGELKAETILHERVHSFLTPKLYPLRNLRVKMTMDGYNKSFIFKYLEEALAETVAQVGTYGFKNALVGIKFPIKENYLTLAQMGTEATGIFLEPINAGGIYYRAYLNFGNEKNNVVRSK